MKKIYFFIFGLITIYSYSQQVVKKVTATQISVLALANGSSLPNTCGNNNISVGDSDEGGTVTVYNASNSVISMNASTYTNISIPLETVGNTTFSNWISSQQNIWSTTNPEVSLSLIRKRARADCNNDSGIDAIIQIWDLPFTQTDGSNIPNGTKLRFASPSLTDIATGGTLITLKNIWYEWNNNTWNSLTQSPGGVTLPILQDWGTFLNTENVNVLEKLEIYPNPTSNFVNILNSENSTENFEYTILDLIGRIVKNGNSNFREQIKVDELNSGNYIIQFETENGKKFTKKMIKK